MSTNKIKPSDLAVWSGDKSMALHAHKPGVSQKVTVQEIIDAVPVPDIDSTEIEAAKNAAIDAKNEAVIAKDAAAVSQQGAHNAYTAATAWSERAQAWAEAPKGAVINNEGSSAKHWALTAKDIADSISGGGSGGGFPGENVDDTTTHDIRKAWAAVSAMGQADGSLYDLDSSKGKHIIHPGISVFLGGAMPIALSSSPIIVGWRYDRWTYDRHDGSTDTQMRVENFGDIQRPSFWATEASGGLPDRVHIIGGLYSKVRLLPSDTDLNPYIDIPGYSANGYAILETIPEVDANQWLYDVFVKGDKTKGYVPANYECVQNLTVNYTKAGDPDGDIVRTFTRKLNGSAGSFKSNWKMVDSGSSGGGSEGGGLPGGDDDDSISSDIPLAWACVSALPAPNTPNSSYPAYMPLGLDEPAGKSILYAGSQPYSGGKIERAYSTSPCIFKIGGKAQRHSGGELLNLLPGDRGNVLPYVNRGGSAGWQSIILGTLKSIFHPYEIDSEPVFAGYIKSSAIVETTPMQDYGLQDFNFTYDIIANKAPNIVETSFQSFQCIQELTIVWAPSEGYYGERTPENYAGTITRKYRRVVSDAIGRFEGGNWKLIAEL